MAPDGYTADGGGATMIVLVCYTRDDVVHRMETVKAALNRAREAFDKMKRRALEAEDLCGEIEALPRATRIYRTSRKVFVTGRNVTLPPIRAPPCNPFFLSN